MKSRNLVSIIGLAAAIAAVAAVYVSWGGDGNAPAPAPVAIDGDAPGPEPHSATGTPTTQAASNSAALASPKSGRLAAFVVHREPEPIEAAVTFANADGDEVSLSDWQGKVVLVNFWATWCAPCRHEMPTLDNLNAELGGEDFEVVALSLDRGGFDKPRDFFAETGVETLALYNDASGKSGRAMRAIGMPTTVLIGRDGKELGRIAGPAEWDSDAAKALIRSAMAGTS